MDQGLVEIIVALIGVLGTIIMAAIVPLIKEKTTKEQRNNMESLVKIAVEAAEQMAAAGLIQMPKKEFVIEYLTTKHKIKITTEQLDVMIEKAVLELKKVGKELKKEGAD